MTINQFTKIFIGVLNQLLLIQTLMKHLIHLSKHYNNNKKNYIMEDWVVIETIIKHSIKIFEC